MRRALLTVAIGLAGATVVTGAGWGLQMVALTRPDRAHRVAAAVVVWLQEDPFAVDVFSVDGHEVDGACLGTRLHLQHRLRSAQLAAAAGCPVQLANTVDRATQLPNRLVVEPRYAAHQPALALKLPRIHHERLTIYVSLHGDRPLVVLVARDGTVAKVRLYLRPATAQALRRFHFAAARSEK